MFKNISGGGHLLTSNAMMIVLLFRVVGVLQQRWRFKIALKYLQNVGHSLN